MPEYTTAAPFLASTARWTASARAKESEREDRLVNDPWAAALAGDESAQWLARQAGGSLGAPEGFLSALGWQASLIQPGAPDANFGRRTPPVFPAAMPGVPHNWYVTASKQP